MRAVITPFYLVSIARKTDSDQVNRYRSDQFRAQLEMSNVSSVVREGINAEGLNTFPIIVPASNPLAEQRVEELAFMHDVAFVTKVNSDGSAYKVNTKRRNGSHEAFIGYWKSAPARQSIDMRLNNTPFVYDRTAGTYYVIGS